MEDTNRQAPYETVNGMKYLDAVINKALKRYPSDIIIDSLCMKDFEQPSTLPGIKPIIIKKGQGIWMPIYELHYDPKYVLQRTEKV